MSSEDDIEESKTEHSDCLNVDLKREFTALIHITKFFESMNTIDD
jgi:flagellar basal body rod protein FlgG